MCMRIQQLTTECLISSLISMPFSLHCLPTNPLRPVPFQQLHRSFHLDNSQQSVGTLTFPSTRHPYEVTCDKAFDRVYLVGAGHEEVVSSELIHVLNGAVVGLVACDPGADEIETGLSEQTASVSATGELSYTPGRLPPRPSSSSCLGLALIRGASSSLSSTLLSLHVLTPLPPPILAHTRVLIKGELELPVWDSIQEMRMIAEDIFRKG